MGYGTLIETRSIDYVPLAERHGKVWHLWPVWFSGDAHLATVAVGVLGIILGGNLLWTSVAVILGCLLGTFFMAFHSTQGPQLGLPQMIQSRPQFGYTGALLVWGVAMVVLRRLQRLQHGTGGAGAAPAHSGDPGDFHGGDGAVRTACTEPGRGRLRQDSPRAARARLPDDRDPLGVLRRRAVPAETASRAVGPGRLSCRAVPRAAVRRGGLPAQLVDLRLGLLALPAARRRRARIVLVDLPRSLHRRRLDDAGRHASPPLPPRA